MDIRFLSGRRVYLRALEETDVERCHRWINDPEVRRFLLSIRPMDLVAERSWFAAIPRSSPPSDVLFSICLHEGERHIGTTALHRIDWPNRKATSGTLIGEKETWGQGYGTEAKDLLLRYAFDTLGLHRVSSEVLAFNERSARHLVSNGYVEEGRRRSSIFRDGKWWDEVLFGVLADEWRGRVANRDIS